MLAKISHMATETTNAAMTIEDATLNYWLDMAKALSENGSTVYLGRSAAGYRVSRNFREPGEIVAAYADGKPIRLEHAE